MTEEKLWTSQQKLTAKAVDVKSTFLELAEKLDKHHSNVNIARTTGSSVAILAGLVAVACGIAAPFTLGAAIPAAIIAGSFAAAGGVTSGFAGIFNFGISKHTLRRADKIWTEFKQQYTETAADISRRLKSNWDALAPEVSKVSGTVRNTVGAARGALVLAGAGGEAAVRGGVATGVSATGKAAGAAASTGARVVSVLGSTVVIANVVLIGFSVFDLVDASLEIHRERKSPAGDVLRDLVKELDRLIDEKDPVIFPNAAESED